jgi:hypothetical protein
MRRAAPAERLLDAALRFSEVASGPLIFDTSTHDAAYAKARRNLLRAAREYARYAIAANASRTYHREINRHMKALRERTR